MPDAQVQPAYAMLDAFHHGHVEGRQSVTAIIAEAEHLRESQDLFELYVVDYIMLTRCKVHKFSLACVYCSYSRMCGFHKAYLMTTRQEAQILVMQWEGLQTQIHKCRISS